MVVDRIVRALEAPLVVRDAFESLDAIVVLGAPLGSADRITPALAERAHAAAELYRAGGAPLVVASGGLTHGASRAEADAIADELRRANVPDEAIVVERASKTTVENARCTRELLARRGTQSLAPNSERGIPTRMHVQGIDLQPIRVWLVTQPFHGRRARRLFRGAGFDAHVWHIDNSLEYRDRARAMRWVVREYAAWIAMLARGR
ncbi:MAG: YdcF family protein [Kofleriaceae bacterium]